MEVQEWESISSNGSTANAVLVLKHYNRTNGEHQRHQTRLSVTRNRQPKGWRSAGSSVPYNTSSHAWTAVSLGQIPALRFPGANHSHRVAFAEWHRLELLAVAEAGCDTSAVCREAPGEQRLVLGQHPAHRGKEFWRVQSQGRVKAARF